MEITLLNNHGEVARLSAKGAIAQRTPQMSDMLCDILGPSVYHSKVLLSLAGVTFLDSTGVGWLLQTNKRFTAAGGMLVIHSIPPAVLDVMNVMQLSRILKLSDDEASALATIQGVTA